MVKLSQQLEEPSRLTRTQRKQIILAERRVKFENEERQRRYTTEKEKISGMELAEYKNYYPTLPEWLRSSFQSPSEIEASKEYQDYIKQKLEYEREVESQKRASEEIAEWEQAQKLIFAGKEGSARGDPSMLAKIRKLKEQGFQRATQKVQQRLLEEKYGKEKIPVSELHKFIPTPRLKKLEPVIAYEQLKADAEVEKLELEALEQRKEEREPFVDIEEVRVRKDDLGFWQTVGVTGRDFIKTLTLKNLGLVYGLTVTGGTGVMSVKAGETPIIQKAYKEAIDLDLSIIKKDIGKVIDIGREATGELGIPVFTAGEGSIVIFPVSKGKEDISKALSEKELELFTQDLEKRGLEKTYKPRFEAEYQARFEDVYGKKLIKGEITFEEAEEKFRTSEEAKLVAERYSQVIDIERGKKITWESAGLYGTSLAKLGIKLIPESPSDVVLETAVISSAVYGLKAIPPPVVYAGTGAFGVYGGLTALDPRVSPEERVGGIVIAGLSAGFLGYQGIKYLKQPTIKPVKIKPPKISLKTQVVGREGLIVEKTSAGITKQIEDVAFGKQKIQQIGIAGRRVIVSTKWRDILSLDPIYRGVPTAQKGTTYALQSLRGTYTYTTPSGYQKALALLKKSTSASLITDIETKTISLKGLSSSQLKGILKYTAPRVIDVTLEKGLLKVITPDQRAFGKFVFRIDQPVIDVDKTLGIKTRGAKSIREIYAIDRKIIGKGAIQTDIIKTKVFVNKEGASYNLLREAGKTQTRFIQRSLVKATDIKDTFRYGEPIKVHEKLLIQQEIPYKFQELGEVFGRKQIIPLKRKAVWGARKSILIKAPDDRVLINIDLDEIRGYYPKGKYFVEPAKITKTPLSKTFRAEAVNEIKEIVKGKTSKFDWNEIKRELEALRKSTDADITRPLMVGGIEKPIESYYAGKGLYERTGEIGGGIGSTQINQALKTGFSPTINIKTQIKSLLNMDQAIISSSASKLGLASLSALKLAPALRTDLKLDASLKSTLKTSTELKQILKLSSALKTAQPMKISQALKLEPSLTTPSSFVFTEPVIPEFKLPPLTIKPFIFPFPLTAKEKLKKKLSEKKMMQELLYLPDFTARSLGLEPEILTERQAQKNLRKVLTGFEIRKPIKLLKGIPA